MHYITWSKASDIISISSSEFNLPLRGSFTWITPPGPYRVTTCRGRELNFGSHTYFFDNIRTWKSSPDECSAYCRGYLRDSTNMKNDKLHTSTHSFIPTRRIWNDDYGGQMIFFDLVGLKFLDICLTGEEKTHPGNLSQPGIEPGPAAWKARKRWTIRYYNFIKTRGLVVSVPD